MPRAVSAAAGPMPERIRMAGEWMAPAQSRTWRRRFGPGAAGEADLDAGGAAVGQQHAVDQGVAADFQVRAAAGRLQVGFVGGDAPPVAALYG